MSGFFKAAFPGAVALMLIGVGGGTSVAREKYTVFDPPGSVGTYAYSMSDKGAIAGDYDDGTTTHGFVRAPDGTITSFDVPNSISTTAWRISAKGAITGYYDNGFGLSGFVRAVHGTFASFDPRNSEETFPYGINADGTML
jgi:hypothetical protein